MDTFEKIGIWILVISLLCSVGLNLWLLFINWFTKNYIVRGSVKSKEEIQVEQVDSKRVNDELVTKIVDDFKKLTQQNDVLQQENRTLAESLEASRNSYSKLMGKFLDKALRVDNLERQLLTISVPIKAELYKKSHSEIDLGGNLTRDNDLEQIDLEEEEVSLDIDPRATIEVGSTTFADFEHLGDIMTGHDSKSDLESIIVVAKMERTVVYDDFLNKIQDAKSNISNLLARVDDKLHSKDGFTEYEERVFYNNTGFDIASFLPNKSA